MNCDYCEDRVGCSLRKKHDDGTAAFSCDIDFSTRTRVAFSRRSGNSTWMKFPMQKIPGTSLNATAHTDRASWSMKVSSATYGSRSDFVTILSQEKHPNYPN